MILMVLIISEIGIRTWSEIWVENISPAKRVDSCWFPSFGFVKAGFNPTYDHHIMANIQKTLTLKQKKTTFVHILADEIPIVCWQNHLLVKSPCWRRLGRRPKGDRRLEPPGPGRGGWGRRLLRYTNSESTAMPQHVAKMALKLIYPLVN